MSVTLILEDGTGKSDATSYVDRSEFEAYWTQRGVDYTCTTKYTDDVINAWLNEATFFADTYYCYDGIIASLDQALQVPRLDWCDKRGNLLDSVVPTELKNAVCELAAVRHGVQTTGSVEGVKSKTVGPLSVQYSSPKGEIKKYPSADAYMKGLLCIAGSFALPR